MLHAAKKAFIGLIVSAAVSGCASNSLNEARRDYHSGHYKKASDALADKSYPERDRVLFKMERGMIRQAAGDYEGSNKDFIGAFDDMEDMRAISVSQDTASMMVNDYTQDYMAAPFERTLLHAFTAKNQLMLTNAENAAVEARRIIKSLQPEQKKDYPEDAYSRYMAGFCLSLMGDWSNAGLQYREASKILKGLTINERSGMISDNSTNALVGPLAVPSGPRDLAVFTLMGRSPSGQELLNQHRPVLGAGFAEIYIDGKVAGRSYELADTVDLAFTTKQKDAIKDMAKTVSRIAIKEATAYQLDQHNELIGAIYRIIMIGILEQPDVRRWETLPRSLQVARIPCPENPGEIEIRFVQNSGGVGRTIRLKPPFHRVNGTYIIVVRDSQPVL